MNFKYFVSLIALIIAVSVYAQITEQQKNQIDSLFIDWNKPNHPGGAINIMKSGNLTGTAEAMASSPNRMYYGISNYVEFKKNS